MFNYAPKDDVCGSCSPTILRDEVHKILHQVAFCCNCRLVLNCVRAIPIGHTTTCKPIASARISVAPDTLRSGRFAAVVSIHMGSLHQKRKEATTFIITRLDVYTQPLCSEEITTQWSYTDHTYHCAHHNFDIPR